MNQRENSRAEPGEPFHWDIVTASASETEAVGERLAGALRPGAVVALYGPLGAGKTRLAKGLARGLGVEDEVTSPTYTIISEYGIPGGGVFHHIDAYRLRGEDDFVDAGGAEIFADGDGDGDGGGVAVVEWAERIPGALPPGAITVTLEIREDGRRRIRVEGGR